MSLSKRYIAYEPMFCGECGEKLQSTNTYSWHVAHNRQVIMKYCPSFSTGSKHTVVGEANLPPETEFWEITEHSETKRPS